MAGKRLIGIWAGDKWNLSEYTWRSPCVKSPLSGENMRAIVTRDDKGQYHPGLRNSHEHGAEYKTVYQDFTSYRDKERAIDSAKELLKETLESHEQTRNHLGGDAPNMHIEVTPPKESPQSRFDALLSKLRQSAPKRETPVQRRDGRSIDR